jgi:hypothetical protein
MRKLGLCLLFGCSLVAGCKKSEPAVSTADTQDVGEAVPSPRGTDFSTTAPPAVTIAPNADTQATLSQLSLELRRYVVRTHKIPKNFEEFAANSNVQFPPPPAGKKYAIQGQEVVLK